MTRVKQVSMSRLKFPKDIGTVLVRHGAKKTDFFDAPRIMGKFGKCNSSSQKGIFTGGIKKPVRYRSGQLALREIRQFQQTTNLLIRKIAFQRLVKEIALNIHPGLRIQLQALLALQVFMNL